MDTKKTSKIKDNKDLAMLAINKPKGIICTHNDEKNRRKIYDLVPKNISKKIKGGLHSIGRLDFNSQGLILLTNNTKIKIYLEKPSSKIIRVYKVKVQGLVTDSLLRKARKGIYIENKLYSVLRITIIKI